MVRYLKKTCWRIIDLISVGKYSPIWFRSISCFERERHYTHTISIPYIIYTYIIPNTYILCTSYTLFLFHHLSPPHYWHPYPHHDCQVPQRRKSSKKKSLMVGSWAQLLNPLLQPLLTPGLLIFFYANKHSHYLGGSSLIKSTCRSCIDLGLTWYTTWIMTGIDSSKTLRITGYTIWLLNIAMQNHHF